MHEKLKAKYLARIPGAELVGWRGLVRLPDGSFASEVLYGNIPKLRAERGFAIPLPGPGEKLSGPCFFLGFPWWRNYGHWHRDVLGQLYGVLPLLPRDTRFVVPLRLAAFQRETIRALGISEERLVPMGSHQTFQVEDLFFTPHTESPAPRWRWLREGILSAYGICPTQGTRRLYISRRDFARRGVLNEAEVEACLANYGFETIMPEKLSHRDQVALFAQAKVIVGSHGAGLTNVLYAPRGACLIDILAPTFVTPFFLEICDALECRYVYFFGETIMDKAGIGGKEVNLNVPIDKLVAALTEFGLSA
jgi:capsular polysaccharide biosynthesis protein